VLFDTMRKVSERLQIGSEETAANKPEGFFYKGLRVRMEWKMAGPLQAKFVIILDGVDYLESTELTEIGREDDDRPLDSEDMVDFRSVISSVGYMATAFIPALSVEASILGRLCVDPTVRSARKANAVIRIAKDKSHVLTFQPGVDSLLVFADSAGLNERRTQGGRLYCMPDAKCEVIVGTQFRRVNLIAV
jgi:hypothetical protein